ncbi:isoleucyl-tRNA synthetase,cytoplasmic [Leptodontidium sp. 2 PMI_412]|nr:isoleucyl-tRNA synthetase,cytoplasmic [Leptodontidium sp. 2 PMI_412]
MAINFAREEEAILTYWKEIGAFERLQQLSEDKPPYTFYDEPPFATGLPHYAHLLVSTIKDCICRYWAMKGHLVNRRFGWDTHRLPIEYEIDKKFGITGKEAVEKLGIAQYNAECKAIVMRYADVWRETITRLGRWVDFENDYKTMDAPSMESVWWVFKQLFEKDAVYRGYKVMPYSTALATPLSNFETAQNYKDRQDPTAIVNFPLVDDPETCLFAWTTTPWTLPMNLAIAVNPDLDYVKVQDKKSGKSYILLESSLGMLNSDKNQKDSAYTVTERFMGKEMYKKFRSKGFRFLTDSYVVAGEGVGLVHQAPAYGEEDYQIAMKAGIIPSRTFRRILSMIMDAERGIIKHPKSTGRLVQDPQIMHSYPHCPRSDTPLIYRAVSAWFVKTTPIIPDMLKMIDDSRWVLGFVKEKRFMNWIANAHDWNVSRDRYWGTPLPLWVSEDYSEVICVGSIKELKELSGYNGELTDIHRDIIDEITIPSRQGKGQLRRISEVFDCWFESGSMPYASGHYPFEKDSVSSLAKIFPADFITEGLDQTRGWFYTILVIGTHLFGVSPYRNCIINGMVLAEDGKKMSKRLKNYPDPQYVIDTYGVDALRLYLINSPVVRAESLRFKESGVKEVIAKLLLPLWNSYKFFEGQVQLLKKTEGIDFVLVSLVKHIDEEMAEYRLYTVFPLILNQIEATTNWYIRFNRDRLKSSGGLQDTLHALNTLFDVLFTIMHSIAPYAPFIADKIYNLLLPFVPLSLLSEDHRSIHFSQFPIAKEKYFNEVIECQVGGMQNIIELGRNARERQAIGLKTPLKSLVVLHPGATYLEDVQLLQEYICRELNIRDLITTSDEARYDVQYSVMADFPVLGKKLKQNAKKVFAALPKLSSEQVRQMTHDKRITVEGVEVDAEDLVIRRSLGQDQATTLETSTDGEDLLILNLEVSRELKLEGLSREVINRVQKLRKKAGLASTDDVKWSYLEEEQEVQRATFLLRLCSLN